ncbi:hypothetical protein ACWKSP_28230 [Micromonosporaceae bacterium Da 78-11]
MDVSGPLRQGPAVLLLRVRLQQLIDRIKSQAKNATIVLVGYPRLFAVDHGGSGGVFTTGEVDMLNRLADYMAAKGKATVYTAKARGAKPGTST